MNSADPASAEVTSEVTGIAEVPSRPEGGGNGGGDGGSGTNVGHSCSNTPPGSLHSLRQGFLHFFLHFLGFAESMQLFLHSITSGSILQSFLQNFLPHFGSSGDGASGG